MRTYQVTYERHDIPKEVHTEFTAANDTSAIRTFRRIARSRGLAWGDLDLECIGARGAVRKIAQFWREEGHIKRRLDILPRAILD